MKKFTLFIFIVLLSGCASSGPDSVKLHDIAKPDMIEAAIESKSLAPIVALPIAESFLTNSFLSEMLIKNEHSHLKSTDALLSSLKDPYFKYVYKNKELWIYLDIVGTKHDFISNLYFVVEGKNVNDLYIKLKDVPNGNLYVKDESYVDPWRKYREY